MGHTAGSGDGIFDVRDFGAVGDGVADDTNAIQLAFDAAARAASAPGGKGGVVSFPAGRYRITQALTIADQTGIQLRGSGIHLYNKPGPLGPRVTLTWDPPSQPTVKVMLRISGCNGMTIADIKLEGDASDRGDVTLIEFEDSANHPSLFNTLMHVALSNAATGIRMKSQTAGQMVFERVQMLNLATGFQTTQTEDTCYYFRYLDAQSCDTVLDLQKGGCIDAHFIQLIGCGKDETQQTDPTWCLDFGQGGPHARCSVISTMHIEQVTRNLLRIAGDHRVTVLSHTEGADCVGKIHVDSGALICRGCSFITPHSAGIGPLLSWEANSRKTTVRFRDCLFNVPLTSPFDPEWVINTPTEPDCYYSFERCDRGYLNYPIPDVKTAW